MLRTWAGARQLATDSGATRSAPGSICASATNAGSLRTSTSNGHCAWPSRRYRSLGVKGSADGGDGGDADGRAVSMNFSRFGCGRSWTGHRLVARHVAGAYDIGSLPNPGRSSVLEPDRARNGARDLRDSIVAV